MITSETKLAVIKYLENQLQKKYSMQIRQIAFVKYPDAEIVDDESGETWVEPGNDAVEVTLVGKFDYDRHYGLYQGLQDYIYKKWGLEFDFKD